MGFFHEGHLELMRVGKRHSDKLIISIFVNPLQFGLNEDYEEYPRDMEGDLSKAREVGVDIVFMPPSEEVYPNGFQTNVTVEKLTKHLCGLSRPGHFDGVTTVIAKFFNIIRPHLAIFGQKDYQQLTVISRMVEDLNLDIQIIGVSIVRDADGMAMSSRNKYLSHEQRKSALSLKKSLDMANEMFSHGEKSAAKIKKAVENLILSHPLTKIDYINICHPITLDEIESVDGESILALAVKIGKTRLIDNCLIGRAE